MTIVDRIGVDGPSRGRAVCQAGGQAAAFRCTATDVSRRRQASQAIASGGDEGRAGAGRYRGRPHRGGTTADELQGARVDPRVATMGARTHQAEGPGTSLGEAAGVRRREAVDREVLATAVERHRGGAVLDAVAPGQRG